MSRSPLELLDAVLDEVEGLRQTDKRSFLPAVLVRELREATEPPTGGSSSLVQCGSLGELVGRTISHVFDSDLRRGDALLMCADGGFLVLEAVNDGDGAYISVVRHGASINDHLRPRDLVTVGLMTLEQKREAEKQEQISKAEEQVSRAKKTLAAAEAVLAALKPKEPEPEPAPSAPSPAAPEGAPNNG